MKQVGIEELDFNKGRGLLPVVVQDIQTREVLTLAYVNREALQLTVSTGYAHFFRRSHNRVERKGDTSGNYQRVHTIMVDCDFDAIAYLVSPAGPACHKGETSCFHYFLVT